MRRTILGELEELVLLVVAGSTEDAYGIPVCEQLQAETGRSFTVSTVHTTLYRLKEKGFLSSQVGGATAERGGRRKRLFAPSRRTRLAGDPADPIAALAGHSSK